MKPGPRPSLTPALSRLRGRVDRGRRFLQPAGRLGTDEGAEAQGCDPEEPLSSPPLGEVGERSEPGEGVPPQKCC
jgi:hypothetical protein